MNPDHKGASKRPEEIASARRQKANRKRQLDPDERRENACRPNQYLGYNRDEMGLYLSARGAELLAEGQFRRAIWLNPFEPEFKLHLAECLFKQHRYEEADVVAREILQQAPDREDAKQLLQTIETHAIEERQCRPPTARETNGPETRSNERSGT